jgi:hypothetical protein
LKKSDIEKVSLWDTNSVMLKQQVEICDSNLSLTLKHVKEIVL